MVTRRFATKLLGLALSLSIGLSGIAAFGDEESSRIFSTISKARDMANEENFKGAEQTFKSISQERGDDLAIEYKQKFRDKLDELANLFLKKHLYSEAEGLYLSRLEAKKEDYANDDMRFLANIALINLQAGKVSEAEKYNQEALKVALRESGPDNLPKAKEAKSKSEHLWRQGNKKGALEETLAAANEILKTQEKVNFNNYMSSLQRSIKANWHPPKLGKSSQVKVRFKVLNNGKITHLRVLESGGAAECDRAAIAAVEKTAPFAALPKYASQSVDVEFTLDYNVH